MTQSVAQKNLIPEKTWRRQTYSPTWWITAACGSVILHLLAFWFLSLYELNSSRQQNGSFATIDFIEISPQKSSRVQSKPKPKTVSPKKPDISTKQAAKTIVPQNSQLAANPSAVKPPVSTNDGSVIAIDIDREIKQLRQQQLAQQQQQELAKLQRQREAEQRLLAEQLRQRVARQEQLEAKLRQREAEQQRLLAEQLLQREAQQRQLEKAQRQREQQQRQLEKAQRQREQQQRQLEKAQRQREAQQRQLEKAQSQIEAQQRQLEKARRQREQQRQLVQKLRQRRSDKLSQNPGDREKITDAIANKVGQDPKQSKLNSQTPQSPARINQNEDIPLNQSGETQLNQSGGILTANWDIDTTTPITKDIPANPPKLIEPISKSFVIPALEAKNFQSANFKVYLLINEEGIVELAEVDRNIPADKRLQYREYVEKHFLYKKLFEPATDPDPRTGELKPRRSEKYIRIKIQQSY